MATLRRAKEHFRRPRRGAKFASGLGRPCSPRSAASAGRDGTGSPIKSSGPGVYFLAGPTRIDWDRGGRQLLPGLHVGKTDPTLLRGTTMSSLESKLDPENGFLRIHRFDHHQYPSGYGRIAAVLPRRTTLLAFAGRDGG